MSAGRLRFSTLLILLGVGDQVFRGLHRTPAEGVFTPRVEGDHELGRQAIVEYGCISCHTVPGIRQATGRVGPQLRDFANQIYIAGRLPNTVDNLVAWIQHPQRIDPGNAMPDLAVSEADACHIAAYLYTLSDR